MDLLGLIDCRRWLISTNGDNYAHPDDAAIAKVIRPPSADDLLLQLPHARTIPWEEHGPGCGVTFAFPRPNRRSLRVTV